MKTEILFGCTMRLRWVSVAVIIVGLAAFSSSILHLCTQPWTQDEGFYLLAARLFRKGLIPVRDFPFQQLPLSAVFISGWQLFLPDSVVSVRLFMWLASILVVLGIFRILKEHAWEHSVLCGSLLFLHPLTRDYLWIAKPVAIATAAALWGVIFSEAGSYLRSGMLLGIGMNTRLLFGAAALVPFLQSLRRKKSLVFLFGMLIPSVLTLWILSKHTDAALFSWVRYHEIKTQLSNSQGGISHVARAFAVAFSTPASWALGALIPFARGFALRWLLIAVLVTLPALRLVPIYDEYFLPFLTFAVLALFVSGGKRRLFLPASLAASCVLLGLSAPSIVHDLRTLQGHLTEEPPNSLRSVDAVGRAIAARTAYNDPVLSWWNGYLVAARRDPIPGLVAGVAVEEMRGKLSPSQHERYHITSEADVLRWVVEKRAKLAVVGLATPKGFEALLQKYYKMVEEVAGARLYVPK
jgi:hypothetical protein